MPQIGHLARERPEEKRNVWVDNELLKGREVVKGSLDNDEGQHIAELRFVKNPFQAAEAIFFLGIPNSLMTVRCAIGCDDVR